MDGNERGDQHLAAAKGFDGDAAMRAYSGPLFLVTLEGDTLAPVKSAETLAGKTSSVPDRWHWAEDGPLDHNRWPRTPDLVVERLVGWLVRQLGGASAEATA